jgi:hypothetical protein
MKLLLSVSTRGLNCFNSRGIHYHSSRLSKSKLYDPNLAKGSVQACTETNHFVFRSAPSKSKKFFEILGFVLLGSTGALYIAKRDEVPISGRKQSVLLTRESENVLGEQVFSSHQEEKKLDESDPRFKIVASVSQFESLLLCIGFDELFQ